MVRSIQNSIFFLFFGLISCQFESRNEVSKSVNHSIGTGRLLELDNSGDTLKFNVPPGYELKDQYRDFDIMVYLFGLTEEDKKWRTWSYRETDYIRIVQYKVRSNSEDLNHIPECVDQGTYFLLPDFENFVFNSNPNYVKVVYADRYEIEFDSSPTCHVSCESNDFSIQEKLIHELFDFKN